MALEMKVEKKEITHVFKLTGNMDSSTTPVVREKLHEILTAEKTPFAAFNMAGVHLISSVGWALLIEKQKEFASKGGDIVMFSMPPQVMRLYGLMGVRSCLRSFDDEKGALDNILL